MSAGAHEIVATVSDNAAEPVLHPPSVDVAVLNQAVPPVDDDSDGMEDSWELSNGLTVGVADAQQDADADGITNIEEFISGSNPQDSAPVVTIIEPANHIAVFSSDYIRLRGNAYDLLDGDLSSSIRWSSSEVGYLWQGASVVRTLAPGQHTVTATVTDSSAGEPATVASVRVDVYHWLPRNGDVDGDGVISISDLVLVQQHLIGTHRLSPKAALMADVYPAGARDGVIDISDLVLIQDALLASGQ